MTARDLMELLALADPDTQVFIDVKPWDEALNLTPAVAAHHYGRGHDHRFVVIQASTEGATRLDPNAE
jgi:hypothetical protein